MSWYMYQLVGRGSSRRAGFYTTSSEGNPSDKHVHRLVGREYFRQAGTQSSSSEGNPPSNDETDAMRASASHRIGGLSHRIGVSDAGPRIGKTDAENRHRIGLLMRCQYFAGDADIIGRHRLNLPPEPPDMRRDSGGFVVSLCPEFTQGRVTPSPSNDETELKRRRHPILTNSTATRTQIQFVKSIHLAWNRSIRIESDELPSAVVHCHQDSTVIKQTKRLVSLTLRNPTPSLVL
ncbi:hypothetical protein PGT21_016243 [Puccinia graminis f. sp. tritici]|uniref:Uncharacterized protein n=1 Tax=Puccinia graminis f. sp. tritici TaxID=56615 RepID=A0A5B0PUI6_PUCGR|nr:hypothetical protein PGT21_016243 [Puccinia graminis f. sp. tritici]